jgi:hypothetical protein
MKIGNIYVDMQAKTARFAADFKKANGIVDRFKRRTKKTMASVNRSVKGLSKTVIALGSALATVGVAYVAKEFVDAASVAEQLNVRLGVMLGSVAEGNRLFQEMTTFASKVPFAYEEIMQSATTLAGIMKGGVDEIAKWMPLIGDLAATTGLSITETTEQVQRMLSAGAASADKFRERGVLAMLGFTAGVSYSVDETRKKLMGAWKDPLSKFKGATAALATTLQGVISMISDKWFALRTTVMDAGLMDFVKAIAMTIDQYFGGALEQSKTKAKGWAQTIQNMIFSVMDSVGFLTDIFRGLQVVWKGLEIAFAVVAHGIVNSIYMIADGWRELANLIPGIDIGPMKGLENLLGSMSARLDRLTGEFGELTSASMPSTNIDKFKEKVMANLAAVQAAVKKTKEGITGGGGQKKDGGENKVDEKLDQQLSKRVVAIRNGLLSEEQEIALSYANRSVEVATWMQADVTRVIEGNALLSSLAKQHGDQKTAIAAKGEADRRRVMAAGLGAAANIFSGLSSLMGSAGKKQNAMQKTLAKASIIASTAQAVMNALAVPPYPLGLALAAGAAIQGAAQLQQVGAGGSVAAPVSSQSFQQTQSTPIPTSQPGQTQQAPNITIINHGVISGEDDIKQWFGGMLQDVTESEIAVIEVGGQEATVVAV